MKIGIMQPYLFPYIGYFQLINAVDYFGIGDNVQYINKGWINRNRKLVKGKPYLFSFSVKKDSHEKIIKERFYSVNFGREKKKVLKCISHSYKKAPYYKQIFELLQKIVDTEETNVSTFNKNQLKMICDYLKIETKFIDSSNWEIDKSLLNGSTQERAVKKLIKLKKIGINHFINPIGGERMYDKKFFKQNGLDLSFLKTNKITYTQFDKEFVPNLSIIDVMMFNSSKMIKEMLDKYKMI